MALKHLGLQMDEDLIRRIDEHRGLIPRQAWIAAACRASLPGLDGSPPLTASRQEMTDRARDRGVAGNASTSVQAKRKVAPRPKKAGK